MAELSKRDLVDLLLDRDVPLNEEQYSRHRQQLADHLEKAKRDERVVRVATLVLVSGALAFLPLVLAVNGLAPRGGFPAGLLGDVVAPGLTLLTIICGMLAIPMLALYLVRYQRSPALARDKLRDAVLVDLQKTIDQCKARLDHPDQSP